MITGMKNEFDFLKDAPFTFHLTGSRAFGSNNPDSDWDFFVEEGVEVENWLILNGFEYDMFDYKATTTKVCRNAKIHVQLVKNFNQKLKAQELLMNDTNLRDIIYMRNKNINKLLWQFAMEVAERSIAVTA